MLLIKTGILGSFERLNLLPCLLRNGMSGRSAAIAMHFRRNADLAKPRRLPPHLPLRYSHPAAFATVNARVYHMCEHDHALLFSSVHCNVLHNRGCVREVL